MNRLHSLALGASLAFGLIGLAHADSAVTGAWKLSVGAADAPCTLTLTADENANGGAVTPTGDCNNGGQQIGHYKTVGPSLQLLSRNGELVAWLKPKADGYEGRTVADGRVVALAR